MVKMKNKTTLFTVATLAMSVFALGFVLVHNKKD